MRRFENFATIVLVGCALVIVFISVRRDRVLEMARRQLAAPAQVVEVEFVGDHEFLEESGRSAGSSDAPVRVVEFLDLECPACRIFQERTMASLSTRLGDRLRVTVVHFPLRMHRFALPAARAAECAASAGRFHEFVAEVYRGQDSLGLRPWMEFARRAGVSDTVRFASCAADTATSDMIRRGLAAAERLRVDATPTIVVNGWRFSRPPTEAQLGRVVDSILAGRDPFPKRGRSPVPAG